MQRIFIYLFNGYSDWELAYITPQLMKNNHCRLVYFTDDGKTVKSMGGLDVVPDAAFGDLHIDDVDLLILPGGPLWEQSSSLPIDSMIHRLYELNKGIAAICGATAHLARLHLLNGIKHTSNALCYLQWVAADYVGDQYYVDVPAIADHKIITAGGVYPIEFAREIMRMLQCEDEMAIDKWYQLYKNGIWKE